MEDTKTPDSKPPRGAGSFCIPRAALNALLDNGATAYEVCTYLTLARFSDETGRYSTASISAVNRYTGANKTKGGPVWRALEALQSAGLVYEVVMVLNRKAIKAKFSSGTEYSDIPEDAEPFYELDCRSRHGYKPDGEEGVGWATAKTAGDFGKPVTLEGGTFDGTYAAFVPDGYPAMIAGIYRLRFRVSNPKNAGVRGAWAGIQQRNREALELVNSIRIALKREPLTSP